MQFGRVLRSAQWTPLSADSCPSYPRISPFMSPTSHPSPSSRLNNDVLLHILEHLNPFPIHFWDYSRAIHNLKTDKDASLRRRTLASLALTCRLMSEPASRLLWTDLPCGLLPLMLSISGLQKVPIQRRVSSTRESQDCSYVKLTSVSQS